MAIIRAKSHESGEEYTVCRPIGISPDGRGVFLGLTQKTAKFEVPEDADECAPFLVQLQAGFGDRFEFSHVRLVDCHI